MLLGALCAYKRHRDAITVAPTAAVVVVALVTPTAVVVVLPKLQCNITHSALSPSIKAYASP